MDDDLEQMETLFKALADQTRLRILGLLMMGEISVCDIHESLKIPQPKTSRHLAYLKRAGLVEDRKKGLWVYYRLAQFKNEPLSKLLASTSQCLNRIAIIEQDRKRLERAHSSNSAVAPAPTTVDVRLL